MLRLPIDSYTLGQCDEQKKNHAALRALDTNVKIQLKIAW